MLDEIALQVIAGKGGDGAVSFRRERYIPKGGPDGGDGGRGGRVWAAASRSVLVLDHLRRKMTIRATDGVRGGGNMRHGKNGDDAVMQVPLGTIIWDEDGSVLADMTSEGRVLIAKGGEGGRGNARFATSTRKAPRIAERGLPGEERRIRLELRLLADVGLIGLPNAGKSSLLQAISQARPKVGAYPFTTLEPSLGIVEIDYDTMVVADIPGLIEGAHEGAGLGMQFLQHIQRTNVLLHVVDLSSEDPVRDIDDVRSELAQFDRELAEKRWLVALNKVDLEGAVEAQIRVEQDLSRRNVDSHAISALTGEGVDQLVHAVFAVVKEEREAAAVSTEEPPAIAVKTQETISIEENNGRFYVKGRGPEEAVLRLGVESEEARAELARRLTRMGVKKALKKAGVAEGDRVRIAGEELQWPL